MICRTKTWLYHLVLAEASVEVALKIKATPMTISELIAMSCSQSNRDWRSFRPRANINSFHGHSQITLAFVLLNCLVNFLGHGCAGETAGFAAFHHYDDNVSRIFKWGVRSEPGCPIDYVIACIRDLRRAGLGADAQAGDRRQTSSAFIFVFYVREHCLTNNPKGARGDAEIVAHAALRKSRRRFTGKNVLRFEARHQPWPEDLPTVGDGGNHDSHLQGRDRHFALADANICGFAIHPPAPHAAHGWKNAAVILPGGQLHTFAQVQPLRHSNDALDAGLKAIRDEVSVAGPNERALKIVLTRRRQIDDGPATNEDATGVIDFRVGIKPGLEACQSGDNFENRTRRVILLGRAAARGLKVFVH